MFVEPSKVSRERERGRGGEMVCATFTSLFQEMQDNYSFLLSTYEKILDVLRDGTPLSEVYSSAYQYIETERPELKDHFTKTIG